MLEAMAAVLKVRQAQQVIATAVSMAAALSVSNTTVKGIGTALGLEAKLIGACKARSESLSDGEWETLFDYGSLERSDKTPVPTGTPLVPRSVPARRLPSHFQLPVRHQKFEIPKLKHQSTKE